MRAAETPHPYGQREDLGSARRPRCRGRVLAQLDAGEASRVARGPARVLAPDRRQPRLERLPVEHGSTGHPAARPSGADPGPVLRAEPRRVLLRSDAQQRRERRAHRVARAVPHRPARRQALHASATTRAPLVSRSWPSAESPSCCSTHLPTGTRRCAATSSGCWPCSSGSGYVVSTRHYRRDMDVATFMATVSPIAAVAVLPLAVAHGGVFGMSATGWTYMLILALLTGVAAHGLLVFAQKTIQIGTHRHRPGGAARPRRRLVVPAARRDAAPLAGGRHRHRRRRAAGVHRAQPAPHADPPAAGASRTRQQTAHRHRPGDLNPVRRVTRWGSPRESTSPSARPCGRGR